MLYYVKKEKGRYSNKLSVMKKEEAENIDEQPTIMRITEYR